MAGFNVIGMKAGAENVFGVTVMPSYKFTPHWEGVVRYQMAAGSNAVKWEKRYTQNSTYSGTSDCMQALYLGVNYYIFECSPKHGQDHGGIEYAHSNGTDASRQKSWLYRMELQYRFPHTTSNCRTVSSRQQLARFCSGAAIFTACALHGSSQKRQPSFP